MLNLKRKCTCDQSSLVPQTLLSKDSPQIFQPQPVRPLGSLVDDHVKASFLHRLKNIPGVDPEPTSPRLCHSAPPTMLPKRNYMRKGSMELPPPPRSAPLNLPNPLDQPAYSPVSSMFQFWFYSYSVGSNSSDYDQWLSADIC